MKKSILLSALFVFYFFSGFSQSTATTEKLCWISSGIGFGGAMNNSKSTGREFWLQLDYKFAKNISLAMEIENMTYTRPGFARNVPDELSRLNFVGNNFSLLFKYHIETGLPVKVAVGGGWTYAIKTTDYYYKSDDSRPDLSWSVSTIDDYEVPVLLEVKYPVWKAIDIQARVKCNFATQNQSTYSSGIGLSLRL